MTDEVVGTLKGGVAAAERAAKEKAERDKQRKASFNPYSFFGLAPAKEGEVYGGSGIYRLVTDEPDWEEAKQHSYIPTKPAPKDKPSDKKWLDRFGAVCRYTLVPKKKANGEIVISQWFDDCYICDNVKLQGKKGEYSPKGAPRQWAWGVEQEEYEDEDGDLKYRDMIVDYYNPETKETEQIQKWVVFNMAGENFFDKLLGYNNVYHTVVDRPYKITRKGSSTDTDYEIVALDPQLEEVDGKSVKIDLRKEPFKSRYTPPVTLFSLIEKQVSDEHYGWYFDPTVESSWVERYGKPEEKSGDSGPTPAATDDDDTSATQHAETLNAMRERLKASKAKASV